MENLKWEAMALRHCGLMDKKIQEQLASIESKGDELYHKGHIYGDDQYDKPANLESRDKATQHEWEAFLG